MASVAKMSVTGHSLERKVQLRCGSTWRHQVSGLPRRVAKAQAAAAKWQAIEEAEVQLAWDMCDCARAEEEAKKPDAEPNTAASTTAADDDGDELAEALEAEFEALDG